MPLRRLHPPAAVGAAGRLALAGDANGGLFTRHREPALPRGLARVVGHPPTGGAGAALAVAFGFAAAVHADSHLCLPNEQL